MGESRNRAWPLAGFVHDLRDLADLTGPRTHQAALRRLAAAALVGGRPSHAFLFAGRLGRLPGRPPDPEDHVLRAEAARRLGLDEDSRAALARALEIDPANQAALRWRLRWQGEALPPPRPAPAAPEPSVAAGEGPAERQPGVSVIIPVHGDVAATRACFEAIAADRASRTDVVSEPYEVLAIDDCTPEPEIRRLLDELAATGTIRRLVNPRNLGFVHSVNRGLAARRFRDALLLNADTLPPPGFVEALATVAASAPSIGTVTPLTNNGELTSFPVPFQSNDLPPAARVAAIHAAAAAVNGLDLVDMPNGVGFCLYVTAACLDAVGQLDTGLDRGYLEDVDFCLRAERAGFRNVCATGIYVGHAGTRSFGGEKRGLVVRNLARLKRRFPDHARRAAAFVAADPLQAARGRLASALIERGMVPEPGRGLMLIVQGRRAASDPAADVVAGLASPHLTRWVASVSIRSGRLTAKLDSPDDGIPHGLELEAERLEALFGHPSLDSIVVTDPAALPTALIERLTRHEGSVQIVAADAGLVCSRRALLRGDGTACRTPAEPEICDACIAEAGADTPPQPGGTVARRAALAALMARATRLIAVHPTLSRLLAASGDLAADRLAELAAVPDEPAKPVETAEPLLAILPRSDDPADFDYLLRLCRALAARAPTLRLAIVGQTPDDAALLALGTVLPTGELPREAIAGELAGIGATHVLHLDRAAVFAPRLDLAASHSGAAIARFAFDRDDVGPNRLDRTTTATEAAAWLLTWMGFGRRTRPMETAA